MPVGWVQRWNTEKGFGFIAPSDGSEDLFIHVSDCQEGEGSILEGDHVLFCEKWDDRKGKYRAAEVELTAEGVSRREENGGKPPRMRSRSRDRNRSRSRGGDRERGEGGARKPAMKATSDTPGKETGIMLRWNADKGFGFIKPDDGGEDLFAHVSALVAGDSSVQDGDKVTYDKDFNERKGKDQAVNVRSTGEKGEIPDRRGGGDRDRDRRGGDRDRDRDRDRRRSRSRGRDRDRRRDRSGDRRGKSRSKSKGKDRDRSESGGKDKRRRSRSKSSGSE
eukprot:TRINITY_DN54583_c0_g1_i1.p1 TRINITY_DN54583_c0_g1~~TRINITY_DN54583_c0_g1_i1.p1  ORF type:complete len:278 (+),score=56.18 TRINITY_DN54583_c0_g1_i1:71-904(+)